MYMKIESHVWTHNILLLIGLYRCNYIWLKHNSRWKFWEKGGKLKKKSLSLSLYIYWLITGTRVHVGPRAHAGTSQTPLEPELTTRPHCTSVRVSVDDKWRASQSKPICTSIRRGSQMGINMHIFSRGEAIHLSQNVAPGRWDKRPPERRKGVWGGVCVWWGPIQLKYLGD